VELRDDEVWIGLDWQRGHAGKALFPPVEPIQGLMVRVEHHPGCLRGCFHAVEELIVDDVDDTPVIDQDFGDSTSSRCHSEDEGVLRNLHCTCSHSRT